MNTYKNSWNFEYKWVNNFEIWLCILSNSYSLQCWFLNKGCNKSYLFCASCICWVVINNIIRVVKYVYMMSRGTLNMSRGSMLLKWVWMPISITNYEYNAILHIFLNTHCWSHHSKFQWNHGTTKQQNRYYKFIFGRY